MDLRLGQITSNSVERQKPSRALFRDIVVLMRDTGMRNERELYRIHIENLDWVNQLIFVPDNKTAEARRLVPMSHRVRPSLPVVKPDTAAQQTLPNLGKPPPCGLARQDTG